MAQDITPLILDLVEWVARSPRPYAEAIDAWRTNCPRLTVWEDAMEGGWIACQPDEAGVLIVVATEAGRARLDAARPTMPV